MATAEEIAWAAGLFEGEGSISLAGSALILQIKNTDKEVLDRFDNIVELGEIYGPYRWQGDGYKRKPFWVWHARGYDAYDVLALIGRWLSARRLGTARELTGVDFGHARFYMESEDR